MWRSTLRPRRVRLSRSLRTISRNLQMPTQRLSTHLRESAQTVAAHHGGGYLGTIAQLHAIASCPNAPWIEILHDPPIAAYTNGFAIIENPPLADKEGYLNLPQGPGLGMEINKI